MRNLSELLGARARPVRKTPPLDDSTLFFLFLRIMKQWFGEQGGQKVSPTRFAEGTLFVKCPSSLWRSELALQKESLLEALNREAGQEAVKEIHISF
jgi:hypothetical protein